MIAKLSSLIRTAAITVIEDGSEKITRSLLDGIETHWTAQHEYEARRKLRKASVVATDRSPTSTPRLPTLRIGRCQGESLHH